MTASTISLTESQTLTALGNFLKGLLPAGVEIVVGQDNRVPAPKTTNYLVMTPILRQRLSTNVVSYLDGGQVLPNVAGVRYDLMPAKVTVQVDVHGPGAADGVHVIATMFRSSYAVAQFAATGFDVIPLYTSEPRQLPFLNESNQVEKRYSIDLVLQCNPIVTTGQDFASRLGLGLISVDAAYPAGGHLSISGKQILDPSGAPITLRGWNWGRWGTAQPQDAAAHVTQGANCVRIPLRWWGLYQNGVGNIDSRDDTATATSSINPDNLAILDGYVKWASDAGLWIILFIDSDCGQNGTQPGEPAYCDPQGLYPNGNNFWSNAVARQQFIDVWKFVAHRYKDTPRIGLFEPLPEPNPQNIPDVAIPFFYDEVMAAIRGVAPGIPFLVGPRSYSIGNAANVFNKAWTDVVYTGDLFLFPSSLPDPITNFQTRLQGLLDLRDNRNVPILVQQVGCQTSDDPNLVYTNAVLAMLNANDVPWTWWEYRDGTSANSFAPWYQDSNGNWILKTATLDTVCSYFKLPRLSIKGANVLLPDGTPFYPFGTNQRWELAKQTDAAYIKNVLGCTTVRIEFPWWQNGSAGDARDDNSPGNISPAYLAQLDAFVSWYTGVGLWVDIALHSKCGRSGIDSSDPSVAIYCASPDDPSQWPFGRNFWTSSYDEARWLETLAFIADRYKNTPYIGFYEPINEPDPQGVSAALVAQFYVRAMDVMLAKDPKALFRVGGLGGYDPTKILTSYQATRSNIEYTFDWFDFPNLVDIPARQASLLQRFQQPLQMRQTLNVPVRPQQFGVRYGADVDRVILAFQIQTLLDNMMPGDQWELRSPTVGPVAGNATYGFVWDRGDGVDTIRVTDQTLMQNGAAAFKAMRGTFLQPGQ